MLSIADLRVAFRLGKEDGVVHRIEAVRGVSASAKRSVESGNIGR